MGSALPIFPVVGRCFIWCFLWVSVADLMFSMLVGQSRLDFCLCFLNLFMILQRTNLDNIVGCIMYVQRVHISYKEPRSTNWSPLYDGNSCCSILIDRCHRSQKVSPGFLSSMRILCNAMSRGRVRQIITDSEQRWYSFPLGGPYSPCYVFGLPTWAQVMLSLWVVKRLWGSQTLGHWTRPTRPSSLAGAP